ncbi:MAG: FHA domain-containing protein [Planctomycetales bacterium]|nr:FHA domain-containing protein [Planctomycetales bacterium]
MEQWPEFSLNRKYLSGSKLPQQVVHPMYGEMIPVGGGDTIPLLKKSLKIGRRESCDIVLRFANVSAHHCQLELRDGYWYAKDLGSRNGTKVNGKRVDEKRIDPGDAFAVAKHKYEFVYSPAENGAVGPPPPDPGESAEQGSIMSKSLLERAGLKRREKEPYAKRYDIKKDSGGRFKDPDAPI